ncbi:MAG: hypothetical protein GYB67_08350 [Chloroflexi bacterium]|nr:hypothetical protein [Chloroflexota bacterium]
MRSITKLRPTLQHLLIMLLLTGLAVGAVAAQPTPPPPIAITPGRSEGNLNDTIPAQRYSFQANRDDSVTISMERTSGDLDSLLLLFGPDGQLIERNDDLAPGNPDARIERTLLANGTYIIEATRFEQQAGRSNGTFRLTLDIAGSEPTDDGAAVVTTPEFGVDYRIIDFGQVINDDLDEAAPQDYYAIQGQQGDFVTAILTTPLGSLNGELRILDGSANVISRQQQRRTAQIAETIANATLPETGWYLIEVAGTSGAGAYELIVSRIQARVLPVGEQVTGQFALGTPSVPFIINARLGDLIRVSMFRDATSSVDPELRLLDPNDDLVAPATGDRFVNLSATIPRTGTYILQANNRNPGVTGDFAVRLTSVIPLDPDNLNAESVSYNETLSGALSADTPADSSAPPGDYYTFSGKTGELVSLTLTATSGDLEPFLILMDTDLNELAANDAISGSRSARVGPYRLPKNGDYLVLATHAGLTADTRTSGGYDLELTAGEIVLTSGAFEATATWAGDADLNLFVRDPSGRTLSWSNPGAPGMGALEIDSNTRCQTISAEPVEHIYWPGLSPVPGDYTVWVWYQDNCAMSPAVEFTLTVRVAGAVIVEETATLALGQRFNAEVRVTGSNEGIFLNRPGAISNPSPQQRASEGGDTLIRYGQEGIIGTLNDQVYARFYRFEGLAGDTVAIDVLRETGDLDPIVLLRDSGDAPLPGGSNDDRDTSTRDSRLIFTLPETDRYTIAVTRFGVQEGTTSGDYRLILTQITQDAAAETAAALP